MEKAALFFEDYLYEGPDGKYIFSPCQSPENAPSNTRSQATFNATMDVAAAKELLNNLVTVSLELGINREKVLLWQEMLAKMPGYMISEEGAVKEWLTPVLKDNYNHRHSSQLYALFDGLPEEIAENSELQTAFKRLIELKLERYWNARQRERGFMSFGLVQLGQAAASLGDADLASRSLFPLLTDYWYSSLASTHNYKSLFNMDISGGLPAVIIKMLVFSNPGRVQLLPALPEQWPSGTIEGVLCRGQIEIERLTWEKGRILLTIRTEKEQTIDLQAPSPIETISVTRGEAIVQRLAQADHLALTLHSDQPVVLELGLI